MSSEITRTGFNVQNSMERTSMDNSISQPKGGAPAFLHEARVVNVNYESWTVDVRTQFDQKFYKNIQVASPYLHANRGDGISCMPEVNAKCIVAIPSDGPPPFLLCFIMPMEQDEDPEGDFNTQDAKAKAGAGPGAVFSGGRPKGKPGDITLRGRDGNFVTLHRGGVLQIGASELSQRIYIPIQNVMVDMSQNYEHHNTGGSINWGISSSFTDADPECEWRQTFRLHANSAKADIRVAVGKIHQPIPNSKAETHGATRVVELAIAPAGFEAESGAPSSGVSTKVHLFFDDGGNTFLGMSGHLQVHSQGNIKIRADQSLELSGRSVNVKADSVVRIDGSSGVQITNSGGAIVLNGGSSPVAAVGSMVNIMITIPIPILITMPGVPAGVPGVITTGAQFTGVIANGSSQILVPPPG